jgi:ABC-type amino acid transport substrate-binding protein
LSLAPPARTGKTLDAVKARGQVVCGVNTGLAGFGAADSSGKWNGLDVDICRATAAAVLGDGDKVKYVPLNSQQRFTALQSGEVDLLSRNTTFTLTRDASLGIVFAGINYYDGQGFMVPKKLKVDSAKKLNGATVCVQAGTTSERNVAEYFLANGMKYKSVVFDTAEAIQSAFFAGRCQVYTTDMSDLAGARTQTNKPDDYTILPDVISKEPLGPAVRRGDDDWFQITCWTSMRCSGRGSRDHAGERRQAEGRGKDPASSDCSAWATTPASCWGSTRSGRTGSSSRSAPTAHSRAQHGPEVAARPAARRQPAVESRRPHVSAAGALTGRRHSPVGFPGSGALAPCSSPLRQRPRNATLSDAPACARPGPAFPAHATWPCLRLPGAGPGCAGRCGLASLAQHRRQPGCPADPLRLRLSRPAIRIRHRRSAVRLLVARQLPARIRRRRGQYAAASRWRASCWRRCSAR